MKNRIAALIILAGILLAILPAPVRADVAPPPIPLVGGVGPFEYQDTNVQMVSERVEMEITPYLFIDKEYPEFSYYRNGVRVDAWFIMQNTGSQDETMQVVFPLGNMNECYLREPAGGFTSYSYFTFDSSTFEAQVNGEIVETKTITTEHPWKAECMFDDFNMSWAAFDVNFPANEDTLIRVSYLLDGSGEYVTNVGYTLETGAAWKGPIGEAIIVFRFPFVVEDFVLPGTTPGYRTMQNEIYWRYENFEPTHKDNISVAYISPRTWDLILDSRSRIRKNPKDEVAWVQLANNYSAIAHWHGPNIRSEDYDLRAYKAIRDGLKENPDSGLLNAEYVELYLFDCCFYDPINADDIKVLQPYIEKAVWYPSDSYTTWGADLIKSQYPDIDVKIGPMLTSTPTAIPTVNKTVHTLTTTWTPRPTQTSRYTKTPTPTSPNTADPQTQTVTPIMQGDQATPPESNRTNWWERAALIASGFVLGIAVMWMQKWRSPR